MCSCSHLWKDTSTLHFFPTVISLRRGAYHESRRVGVTLEQDDCLSLTGYLCLLAYNHVQLVHRVGYRNVLWELILLRLNNRGDYYVDPLTPFFA